VEPGTPPASAMFKVIKRFSDTGVRCAVNNDPIIPLITDSMNDIDLILDYCLNSGVRYILGTTLRLRADIWERMKGIFKILNKEEEVIKEYERLYHFNEPLNHDYNLPVDKVYLNIILKNLKAGVIKRNMYFDFPQLIGSRSTGITNSNNDNSKQLSLMNF